MSRWRRHRLAIALLLLPLTGWASESTPPKLFLRAFADTTFRVSSEASGRGSTAFGLGEFDLFLSSRLSENLSVLAELVFHFEEERDEEFLEVERLTLKYAPADEIGLTVGRVHTAIGYWNHTYHHGRWLQTTISRPDIFSFEDMGGILPVHATGLEAAGLLDLGGMDVQYFVGVFNGRGKSLREIQNASDANDSKALNLQLCLFPDPIPGLQLGLTGYVDAFPEDPLSEDRLGEMDERILMGHLVFADRGLELLFELAHVSHEEDATARRFDTLGLYAQGAYQIGRWTPYVRLDHIDLDEEDPLFSHPQVDLERLTVGVRWDPIAWLALKAEYRSTKPGGLERSHSGVTQAAFTF